MPASPLRHPLRHPRRPLVLLAVAALVATLVQAVAAAPPAVADPAPGQAHLVSRLVEPLPPTEEQYQALVRLEDLANSDIRALHGTGDSPEAHDRVVYFDRSELRAALFARIVRGIQSDHPTADEQLAASWMTATAKTRNVAVADAAVAQYQDWNQNVCGTYHPPKPYQDEWSGRDDNIGYCSSYPDFVSLGPKTPTFEQFTRWGTAATDYENSSDNDLTTADTALTSAGAIAIGTGVAAATAIGTAGSIAVALNASAVVSAVQPFSVLAAANFADSAAFLTAVGSAGVLAVASIVLIALTTAVMAGIKVFTNAALPGQLAQAATDARNTTPDLRAMLATPDGAASVFHDFVRATPSICRPSVQIGTNIVQDRDCQPTPPAGLGTIAVQSTDPQLQVLAADGHSIARGSSVPFAYSATGNAQLSIRDGWFSFTSGEYLDTPLPTLTYTDWAGATRTVRVVAEHGRQVFHALLGAASAPQGATAGSCGTDWNGYCLSTLSLPVTDANGTKVLLQLQPPTNTAPTAPTVTTTTGYADELTSLQLTLPAGAPADPDGDAVTTTWTVEKDYPCSPAQNEDIFGFGIAYQDCRADEPYVPGFGGTPNDKGPLGGPGPHGGWMFTTSVNTVVWHTPGTYRVTVNRTDPYGATTTASQDVTVLPARTRSASVTVAPLNGGAALNGFNQYGIGGTVDVGSPATGDDTIVVNWGDGTPRRTYHVTDNGGLEYGTVDGLVTDHYYSTAAPFDSPTRTWHLYHQFTDEDYQRYLVTVTYVDADGSSSPSTPFFVLGANRFNHPPAAGTTTATTVGAGQTFTSAPGALLAPASDPDGNPLTATLTTAPAHGRATVDRDGTFRYTPDTGFWGRDSFHYSVTDDRGLPQADSFVGGGPVQVVDVAPPVVDDEFRMDAGLSPDLVVTTSDPGSTKAGVLANDPDSSDPTQTRTAQLLTPPTHGTAVVTSNGGMTYTPDPGFAGTDGFTYTATSNTGVVSAPGRVVVDVVRPATTIDDSYSTPYGTRLVVARPGVLGNDADDSPRDGGSVVTDVDVSGLAGTAAVNAEGSFDFTPFEGFHGTTSFTYTVANASAVHSAPTTVTITVGPPVVPTADTYAVSTRFTPAMPAGSGVLANDSGQPGRSLTAALAAAPAHGTVTLAADGSFRYVARGGYTGPDSFSYTTSDGTYTSPPTTVSLTVTALSADLRTAVTAPAKTTPGSTVTVKVRVTNDGPSPVGSTGVAFRVTSGTVTAVSGGAVAAGGRSAVAVLGRLLPGKSATVTLTLQAPAGFRGKLTLLSTATAAGVADPDPSDNAATAIVRVA